MPDTKNELRVSLPSDTEILLEREFDAPRDLVWEAMTNPKYIPQWWGPRRITTEVIEADVRPGGTWRYLSRDTDGTEHPFTGTYLEIVAPERVTWTFTYDVPPFNEHASTETVTLEERDGRTYVRALAVYDSKESRDGMIGSGMEEGAAETYERLEELLPTLR